MKYLLKYMNHKQTFESIFAYNIDFVEKIHSTLDSTSPHDRTTWRAFIKKFGFASPLFTSFSVFHPTVNHCPPCFIYYFLKFDLRGKRCLSCLINYLFLFDPRVKHSPLCLIYYTSLCFVHGQTLFLYVWYSPSWCLISGSDTAPRVW